MKTKINLRKRLPTALVLLALVFVLMQFSPRLVFFLILQCFILASLWEFYNLFRKKNIFPHRPIAFVLAIMIGLSFYFEAISLEVVLFAGFFLAAVYFVITIKKVEKLVHFPITVALTFFGPLYLSFTLNFFIYLREDYGPFYIYFLLTIIFLGDTGAYFFGKLLGRHKMTPMASPRKTWEGSIGGIVFACLGALLAQQVLLKDTILWKAILFGFLIHATAQISDPLESLFKRAVGVKDSSNILPGHGGFLDRIDSLILTAPLFYYLLKFFGLN